MSASDIGGPSPLKFWAENVVLTTPFCDFSLLQKSPHWNKISLTRKRLANCDPFRTCLQIWWTLVHKRRKWDRSSTHSKSTFGR